MRPDSHDVLQSHVFANLAPPPGGLQAMRARFRARQQRRRMGAGLALAALALLVILPSVLAPRTTPTTDWSTDVALTAVAGGEPRVTARSGTAIQEVARNGDIVMVRILGNSSDPTEH